MRSQQERQDIAWRIEPGFACDYVTKQRFRLFQLIAMSQYHRKVQRGLVVGGITLDDPSIVIRCSKVITRIGLEQRQVEACGRVIRRE